MAQTIAARHQGRAYGFFVTLYILLLVAPWILTCYQARKPFLLTAVSTRPNYDVDVHGITRADADIATRFTYALEALNYIAALVALPVVYEILARAAVIHALRTRKTKQLNAKQLFALADRKFIRGLLQSSTRGRFFFFAFLLIVLTIAHVIARSVAVGTTWNQYMLARTTQSRDSSRAQTSLLETYTPYGWNVTAIGLSPRPESIASLPVPNVLARLRQDLIGTHPGEWQDKAWFSGEEGRYFVSTVQKGTTTGLARNLALRMDSEFSCWQPRRDTDYPKDCPGGEQYPFRHPSLKLDICVQGNGTQLDNGQAASPWRNTTDRQRITEKLSIRLIDEQYVDQNSNGSEWLSEKWQWKGDIQCQALTDLAYFELGNDLNNKTFGGKLDRLDESDAELVALSWKYSRLADSPYSFYGSSILDGISDDGGIPVPGPLSLASRAMFGSGSFYDTAEKISIDNPNRDIYSELLVKTCPYPFQRHPLVQYECSDWYYGEGGDGLWAASAVVKLLNLFNPNSRRRYSSDTTGPGKELLDTALNLANQAVMDLSLRGKSGAIFSTPGAAVRQFVMSDATMGAISALLALQVLAILAFVCYTYRLPTWSPTLDALAIARIAHQLKDSHLLRAIGLRTVTKEEMKKISEIDALIGLHEPIPLRAMSSTAAAADRDPAGRGSGLSSATTADASSSHHSRARVMSVSSNDLQMGMSSIPVDVQTVVSEDLDNSTPRSPSQTRSPDAGLSPPPRESAAPRLSLNVADTVPEHEHETGNHPDGPSSPPAYTPRTAGAEPPLNPMPPSYASALAVSELRVGGQGLVTRKKIPRTRDDLWV